MTSTEPVEERSREQHQRYYGLFGADPVSGDGLAELRTSIRQIGQQASDVQAWLAHSGFTFAADAGLAAAARDDHHAFGDAAAIAAAAAAAADSSAQLNIRGAAAIAAYMEGETAHLSVIPDKGSPDGMLQALATIDTHQGKSLSAVEQLAGTAQDLGQLAQMAGPHTAFAPPQLSQMPSMQQLAEIAQQHVSTGLEQLAQPIAPPPTAQPEIIEPLAPDDGHGESRSAPGEHLRDVASHDPIPVVVEPSHQPDTPEATLPNSQSPSPHSTGRPYPDPKRSAPQR
jgi:hypothetical protein